MDFAVPSQTSKGLAMSIKLSTDGSIVSVNGSKFALRPIQVVSMGCVETITEVTPKGRAAKGSKRMFAYLRPVNSGAVSLFLCEYACESKDLHSIISNIARGNTSEGVRSIPCTDIEDALHMAKIFLA